MTNRANGTGAPGFNLLSLTAAASHAAQRVLQPYSSSIPGRSRRAANKAIFLLEGCASRKPACRAASHYITIRFLALTLIIMLLLAAQPCPRRWAKAHCRHALHMYRAVGVDLWG